MNGYIGFKTTSNEQKDVLLCTEWCRRHPEPPSKLILLQGVSSYLPLWFYKCAGDLVPSITCSSLLYCSYKHWERSASPVWDTISRFSNYILQHSPYSAIQNSKHLYLRSTWAKPNVWKQIGRITLSKYQKTVTLLSTPCDLQEKILFRGNGRV